MRIVEQQQCNQSPRKDLRLSAVPEGGEEEYKERGGKGQARQYTDALPDPCKLPADVISIAHQPEQNVTAYTINFAYLTELL